MFIKSHLKHFFTIVSHSVKKIVLIYIEVLYVRTQQRGSEFTLDLGHPILDVSNIDTPATIYWTQKLHAALYRKPHPIVDTRILILASTIFYVRSGKPSSKRKKKSWLTPLV